MISVLETRYIADYVSSIFKYNYKYTLIYVFTLNILLSDAHPAKILIIHTKHATMKINEKFLSSTQARERREYSKRSERLKLPQKFHIVFH